MSTTDKFYILRKTLILSFNTILSLETTIEKLKKEKESLTLKVEELQKLKENQDEG
jgi:hypothetical protein